LGSTASVIVKQGILKPGMTLVCGSAYCKIRSMMDDKGKPIKEAVPSTPVKLIGWNLAPQAGLMAKAVKNEKEAKEQIEDFEIAEKLRVKQEAEPKAPMDIHSLFANLSNEESFKSFN
jgi:translation initiation factor IF-2